MVKVKKFLLLLLAVLLLGAGYAYFQYNRQPPDVKAAASEIKTDARVLVAAFNSDEAAANKMYVDKIVSVTGRIVDIKIDPTGQATVVLESGDPMAYVICSFYDTEAGAVKNLTPGQQITIKGMCTGKLMDVVLNKCSIVP